jgi:hypothetical protein
VWRALPALGFGIVLALAFDQAIRLLYSPATNENRHWSAQTVQYHPVLGWSGYPNFIATQDGMRIQTNSLGYRDREPVDGADARKPGVLFLGDSFTWGDEVPVEARFSDLLEASCGSLCDRLPPIRAINKGIIGYGTGQSLLDYVLAREARPFDVVILALYAGNDLADNSVVDSPTGPRPRPTIEALRRSWCDPSRGRLAPRSPLATDATPPVSRPIPRRCVPEGWRQLSCRERRGPRI